MNNTKKLIEEIVKELVLSISIEEIEKQVQEVSTEFFNGVKEYNLLSTLQAELEDCTTDIATLICGEPPYSAAMLETDFIDWKLVTIFRSDPIIDEFQKITELYVEKTKGPE